MRARKDSAGAPRTSLLVNGHVAAQGLRRSVEQAGGTLHISVNALGDAFGRGRLTPRARAVIGRALAQAGLETHPSLTTVGPGDWVVLRLAPRPFELPASNGAEARSRRARGGLRSLIPAPRVTVSLLAAGGLLVGTALAVPETDGEGRPEPAAAAAEPADLNPSALEESHRALLEGDYRAAVKLAERGDPKLVAATRRQVVASLMLDARVAQLEGRHAEVIRLARRAARFGHAPGARRLVLEATAAMRRAEERRRAAAQAQDGTAAAAQDATQAGAGTPATTPAATAGATGASAGTPQAAPDAGRAGADARQPTTAAG
jgi:hypothetical protein